MSNILLHKKIPSSIIKLYPECIKSLELIIEENREKTSTIPKTNEKKHIKFDESDIFSKKPKIFNVKTSVSVSGNIGSNSVNYSVKYSQPATNCQVDLKSATSIASVEKIENENSKTNEIYAVRRKDGKKFLPDSLISLSENSVNEALHVNIEASFPKIESFKKDEKSKISLKDPKLSIPKPKSKSSKLFHKSKGKMTSFHNS